MGMKLSIIVPVYNVEKYLERCLKSLYALNNIEKEIIIVNDESPDDSYKIIEKYKKLYPEETIVINKKNGGLSSARNTGLKIAKGKYISFIDSDDYVESDKYQEFITKVIRDDIDIGIGNFRYFYGTDEEGTLGEELIRSKKIEDNLKRTGERFLIDSIKCDSFRSEVWDDLFKREFLISNNLFFDEKILHEDLLFSIETLMKAKSIKYYNIPFYIYRQREGSIMHSLKLRNYKNLIEISKKLNADIENLENRELQKILFLEFYKIYKHALSNIYKKEREKFEPYYDEFRKFYFKILNSQKYNMSNFDKIEIKGYCRNYRLGIKVGKVTRKLKKTYIKIFKL